jgi:hypothetical protein
MFRHIGSIFKSGIQQQSLHYVILQSSIEANWVYQCVTHYIHCIVYCIMQYLEYRSFCFLEWSGTESTITETTKWPVVPASDDDG